MTVSGEKMHTMNGAGREEPSATAAGIPKEALAQAAQAAKRAGNEAFQAKKYERAAELYTQALAAFPGDAVLLSNRAAALIKTGRLGEALGDAEEATRADPGYAKGHYRKGVALLGLCQWQAAAEAFEQGLALTPDSRDMREGLDAAVKSLDLHRRRECASRRVRRKHLSMRLRGARSHDHRQAELQQWKQSMSAPPWEYEDWEWRGTWVDDSRESGVDVDVARVMAMPMAPMLRRYLMALSELEDPRDALSELRDDAWVGAWERGMHAALTEQPGAHVLCVEGGAGLTAMLAAKGGARRAAAFLDSRSLYRMSKQFLGANPDTATHVELMPRPLWGAFVAGQTPPAVTDLPPHARGDWGSSSSGIGNQKGSRAGESLTEAVLREKGEVLCLGCLDHTVLGRGILPHLDFAARHLVETGARVMPLRVRVRGAMVRSVTGTVSGFDLSPMDAAFRWYPGIEAFDTDAVKATAMSAAFDVIDLDLQGRADAWGAVVEAAVGAVSAASVVHASAESEGGEGASVDGAKAGDGSGSLAAPAVSPGPVIAASFAGVGAWEVDRVVDAVAVASGVVNGIVLWWEAEIHEGVWVRSWDSSTIGIQEPPTDTPMPVLSHVGPGMCWADLTDVREGEAVPIRVRQSATHLCMRIDMPTPHLPRPHHAYVPRWHFAMLSDDRRNSAYDRAIRRAVALAKQSLPEGQPLHVLDIGAGSGILSMMAARAGADRVVGCEVSRAMCEVGEECVCRNGHASRVTMLHRDVRRVLARERPDGTAPDMDRRADVCVFEIFDCGLIGEGALHALAHARAELLQPGAAMVPCGAQVFCMPVEMRVGEVAGMDAAELNTHWWRPDYEEIDLAHMRGWRALGPPVPVTSFDFYHVDLQPWSASLRLRINADGTCNAVAFWFDLHLDDTQVLRTSPFSSHGSTWHQALQFVHETPVKAGDAMAVRAAHDTYGFAFHVQARGGASGNASGVAGIEAKGAAITEANGLASASVAANNDAPPNACPAPTAQAPPPAEPAWLAQHQSLAPLSAELSRALTQNPLEKRRAVMAALAMATRPALLGLRERSAAQFCAKLMS